jgi:hypothetical protein
MELKKKLVVFALIASLFAVLSGCVKGDFHITVNKNGSAELDYKIGVQSQLLGLMSSGGDPIEEMKKNFQDKGFAVSQYRDGDYTGIEAKKHQDNLKDLASTLPNQNLFGQGNSSSGQSKLNFSEKKGLFSTTYKYQGTVDMSDLKPDATDTMGIQQMMLKQIDLKVTLTLPVKAETQNASRVLPDQYTYQWDLIPGTNGDITLQAKAPNVTNIVIAVILMVIVLTAGVWGIVASRRRKSASPAFPVEDQPPADHTL